MIDVPSDPLASTQAALPVSLIATPRAALFTCAAGERVLDVVKRYEDYDHIPVTEDGRPESRVLGLLDAHRFRDAEASVRVADVYVPLCEEHLIGSDAPIIDFIREAAKHDCKLLVSGKNISGLVTLSDLQALPVRAALFTLITRLELAMSEWIRARFGQDSGAWLARLPDKRQRKIRGQIKAAKKADTFVDELVCTYFPDKVAILEQSPELPGDADEFASSMSAATKLRNGVAHAHAYATQRVAALEVVSTVTSALRWIDALASDQLQRDSSRAV